MTSPDAVTLPDDNPFSRPSPLPFGMPEFGAIRPEHLLPALRAGRAAQRAEWESVASDPQEPTVENTLVALERSGELLTRAAVVLSTLAGSVGGPEYDAISAENAPESSAHGDAFWLDARLYDRFRVLQSAGGLDEQDAWAVDEYVRGFERRGVGLDEAGTARLRALNAEIAELTTDFRNRAAAGMAAAALPVRDEAALAGLDESRRRTLAESAAARPAAADGAEHLVTYVLPSQQPLLTELTDPATRAEVLARSVARGTGTDPATDTRALVRAIARARAERARLLGAEHHAEIVARGATAPDSDAITAMLSRLARPAVRNAAREAEDLAALAAADPQRPADAGELAAGDWSYYAERLRTQRFDVDDAVLRPYLELDSVLERGVFLAAGRLYGLTFTERPDIEGYADGVRVWEVREEDGTSLGLFVGDFYAREHKRGGAWMHDLVTASTLTGKAPVVVNNANITRPPAGEPTLLVWDEVRTLFHEFGHTLHSLLTSARYPGFAGTALPRDFVEYPSQVNEQWMEHPEVLASFARHHVTGEPLPEATAGRLRSMGAYGQGFATSEYLGAALVDQAWHRLGPDEVPADDAGVLPFEAAALADAGLTDPRIPPRYRTTYLNHSFGGGYDASYYAYIWSEVLDAETVNWFRAHDAGNLGLTRAAGETFRDELLSRGNSRDPLASVETLLGRTPSIEPLLARRGLDD
ncbi:M3 family metallopeptidase [Georgenia sp. Z1491]|uniref:M3 family metallopeptidase n=1 Tax=Georgenia sp. Z1491 TaxID=3416707 RepID=UPI003CFAE1D6